MYVSFFPDASILYIDEMLEEMLDGLNVQDTPRLLVLLAAADPIVKFVLQNNPREARLRQGMLFTRARSYNASLK